MMRWFIGGCLVYGVLEVLATRKAMRRTGKAYSQMVFFEWSRESLCGVPMLLIIAAWLVYSVVVYVMTGPG